MIRLKSEGENKIQINDDFPIIGTLLGIIGSLAAAIVWIVKGRMEKWDKASEMLSVIDIEVKDMRQDFDDIKKQILHIQTFIEKR